MFEILPTDSPSVSTSIWISLLVIVVYKVLQWYLNYRRLVAIFDKFPGRKDRHWLWGSMHLHPGPSQAGIDFQLLNCKEFPKINTVWFGKVACILIFHHPDTVKQLLSRSAYLVPKPRRLGSVYEMGVSWLGEGLLIANGQKWARNRRLLTPAFHFEILKPYTKVINQCTDIFLERIETFAKTGTCFESYEKINLLSLDIIMRCAFSCVMDCQNPNKKNAYVDAVHRLSELWVQRSLNPMLTFHWIYYYLTKNGREFVRLTKFLHNFSEDVIRNRKQIIAKDGLPDPKEDGKRYLDFLDIILTAKDSDGQGLTDLEIRNEVDTFMFEGHDTTTSGTSFIISSLAEHPDIQEQCRREVNEVLQGRDDDYILSSDLPKFEYLAKCIKEGLRLHSPVFAIQREVTEDIELDDGLVVPKGTQCLINLHNLHNNPTVWGDDHLEFKPDRFNPENIIKQDPYAFLPFSAGQRNCIGQNFAMNEMKIVLARILLKYRLSLKPGHVVTKRLGIVMRPAEGIWLKAERIC